MAYKTTAERIISGADQESEFRYPINISGVWEREPEIRMTEIEGTKVATIIGRFYLWQKQDEEGGIVEFQADNGVIFYSGDTFGKTSGEKAAVAKGAVEAVYFSGNIVMTEGERTIRAEEMFYDFVNKRALAVKAEMRKFDVGRGLPIYPRETLRPGDVVIGPAVVPEYSSTTVVEKGCVLAVDESGSLVGTRD